MTLAQIDAKVVKWTVLMLIDFSVLATGGVLWSGYGLSWGLLVAAFGLAGLLFAAYEAVQWKEQEEALVDPVLNQLSSPVE